MSEPQPLTPDEWTELLRATMAGGVPVSPTGSASLGRLIIRGLVASGGPGCGYEITPRGLEALEQRAHLLAGCTEGSAEEAELETIADALDAYESRRAKARRV